jgi:RND family efflux transporter MFP subunit
VRRPTIWIKYCFPFAVLALTACAKQTPPQAAPQAMPVQTATVAAAPVPQYDEYVSTIKSRRSATIQPQVDGNLTKIYVHSGDHVHSGQVLMEIDPAKQEATVASTKATEQQKLAVFQYNQIEVERQRKLFEQGVTSRDALDQAEQAYKNSQADYESSTASTQSQRKQLGYYHIAAPFDGIVGDVPVHLGDYVSATTMLTTVDENRDLEVYVYIPAERVTQIRKGLPIVVVDNQENVLERTAIDFISPQVDNGLQGILVKAPVHADLGKLRNLQQIKARVMDHVLCPGRARAGGHSTGRANFCVRRYEPGRQVLRQAATHHHWRYGGQRLRGAERPTERGQGHRVRDTVSDGWGPCTAARLGQRQQSLRFMNRERSRG